MAVGLDAPSHVLPVTGLRLGVTAAGVRYAGRRDLTLLVLEPGTTTVAAFTRNRFRAAPVLVAEEHLQRSAPRALIVNTGNANAGTGAAGLATARASCAAVAEALGIAAEAVLPFSTGVIGEPVDLAGKIAAALPACLADLAEDRWLPAAAAIMTTDTVPKAVSRQVDLAGTRVTITGMAKGSGMIRPDMATMLAFIATDAPVAHALLRTALDTALARSFNRITVDGDTSTNDACVLMATGTLAIPPLESADDPRYGPFLEALVAVMQILAQAIVRDGEGASKFIPITVRGGRDPEECLRVAYRLAHSPLVKTAFFASDPNWGRLLAAIGAAGVDDLDVARVQVWLGDLAIVRDGARHPDYREEQGKAVMAQAEIPIEVDLGRGEAAQTIWTCDLSYDYVRINADYRS